MCSLNLRPQNRDHWLEMQTKARDAPPEKEKAHRATGGPTQGIGLQAARYSSQEGAQAQNYDVRAFVANLRRQPVRAGRPPTKQNAAGHTTGF
jgi:hypothetical protein